VIICSELKISGRDILRERIIYFGNSYVIHEDSRVMLTGELHLYGTVLLTRQPTP
jgi:hypothetical protein